MQSLHALKFYTVGRVYYTNKEKIKKLMSWLCVDYAIALNMYVASYIITILCS